MCKKGIRTVLVLMAAIMVLVGCTNNTATTNTTTVTEQNSIADYDTPSDFYNGYEQADFQKYNSPASENGLGGTLIYIEGTASDFVANNFTITDVDNNKWLVLVDYSEFESQEAITNLINKPLVVCGKYEGFSNTLQLPAITIEKVFDKSTGSIIKKIVNTTQAPTTTQATTTTTKKTTGNYLIDLDYSLERIMNGAGTEFLGFYINYDAKKEQVAKMSQEDFRKFVNSKVKNSPQINWTLINFGDGTGIIFTGNNTEIATYGNIDSDGSLESTIKDFEVDKSFDLSKILK